MRLELEQLKAMSDEQLGEHWVMGKFPFEMLPCGNCLTMHDGTITRSCKEHSFLRPPVSTWIVEGDAAIGNGLRINLDELYALRLFYDSLYPQPAESESNAVAAKQ